MDFYRKIQKLFTTLPCSFIFLILFIKFFKWHGNDKYNVLQKL